MPRVRRHFGLTDTRSFGASVWEFFNPDKVRAEYEALGLPPPTTQQIWESAVNDAITAARESTRNVGEYAERLGGATADTVKFLGIALVAGAVLYALGRERKGRRK